MNTRTRADHVAARVDGTCRWLRILEESFLFIAMLLREAQSVTEGSKGEISTHGPLSGPSNLRKRVHFAVAFRVFSSPHIVSLDDAFVDSVIDFQASLDSPGSSQVFPRVSMSYSRKDADLAADGL